MPTSLALRRFGFGRFVYGSMDKAAAAGSVCMCVLCVVCVCVCVCVCVFCVWCTLGACRQVVRVLSKLAILSLFLRCFVLLDMYQQFQSLLVVLFALLWVVTERGTERARKRILRGKGKRQVEKTPLIPRTVVGRLL